MAKKFKPSKQHKMIVVRHRPMLTLSVRVAVVIAFVGFTLFAYRYGYRSGAALQATLEAELQRATASTDNLAKENADLTQALTNVNIGIEIDRQANEAVRQELVALKATLQKAEEENRFYKNIMNPEQENKGPELGNWEISESNGEYHFKLVAKQLANHTDWIKGEITLTLEGQLAGEAASVNYAEISTLDDAKLTVKFRYFQTLTGSFTLPEGFAPEFAVATLTTNEKKPKTVSQQFVW